MKKIILIMIAFFAIHGMELNAAKTYWGGPANVTYYDDGSFKVNCPNAIVCKCIDVIDDRHATIYTNCGPIIGTILNDPGADNEGRMIGDMYLQIEG